jgi:flagellar M-ring protein FliF
MSEQGDLPEISIAAASEMLPDLPALTSGPDGVLPASVSDDPVDRLRSMIGERQEETVEIRFENTVSSGINQASKYDMNWL